MALFVEPRSEGVEAACAATPDSSLRLAEGTELLGQYEGSAYQEPHYLVRRGDGQVLHLSHLLYLVLLALNGKRDLEGVAVCVSKVLGRSVVADNVGFLVEKRLRPLGLLASSAEVEDEALSGSKPLLALRYRTKVIPARLHRTVTAALQPLFRLPAVLFVLGGLLLGRLARAIRKWWPTHRLLSAALVVVVAGALFVQGQALVSHLTAQPRAPAVTATTGPTSSSAHSTPPPLPTAPPPSPVVQPPPTTQPAVTTHVYVVQPGDTLWALAARYLGNPLRYEELFALNKGVSQADGHTLVDPNLIYPGMQLLFPADATGIPTSSVTSAPAPQATGSPIGGGGAFTTSGSSP